MTPPERAGDTELRIVAADDVATCAVLAHLYADAYTGLELNDTHSVEHYADRLRQLAAVPDTVLVAAYRHGKLVGAMRWHDYTMRLRGRDLTAGGLGAVAVALDARRRGVAHDLVRAFVESYREAGAAFALLHPFRHDFYRRTGFGHGTKMNGYRLSPLDFPSDGEARAVRRLEIGDAEAMLACYERFRGRTNGLLAKTLADFRRLLENSTVRAFGYVDDGGTLRGYVVTIPQLGAERTPNASELHVEEPVYESPRALASLFAFLHGLADQFAAIVLVTQDDTFHFIAHDPRNRTNHVVHWPAYHETNVQGAGVMYRILDVARAFGPLCDGNGATDSLRLALTVADAFLPAVAGTYVLAFERGCLTTCEISSAAGAKVDVTLQLDVAELSSLLVGAVRLRALYDYRLAAVSDEAWIDPLERLFAAPAARCMTGF